MLTIPFLHHPNTRVVQPANGPNQLIDSSGYSINLYTRSIMVKADAILLGIHQYPASILVFGTAGPAAVAAIPLVGWGDADHWHGTTTRRFNIPLNNLVLRAAIFYSQLLGRHGPFDPTLENVRCWVEHFKDRFIEVHPTEVGNTVWGQEQDEPDPPDQVLYNVETFSDSELGTDTELISDSELSTGPERPPRGSAHPSPRRH